MIDVDNCEVNLINSRIHGLSSIYKVLSVFFMWLFLIIADSLMDVFMINLFLFVLIVWSNIRFRSFLKIIYFFSIFIFLIFFILSIVCFDMVVALLWIVKIIDLIIYMLIIGLTTGYYDLIVGVNFIFKPISSFCNNSFIYNVSSFMKYIGFMYEEIIRIEKSKRVRGISSGRLGFIDRIDMLCKDFINVVKFTWNRIDIIKNNVMVNKGELSFFNYKFVLNKWSKTDTIMLIINFFMLFAILIY